MHFICKRDARGSLKNLVFDKASRTFRSGQWDMSEDDARALVEGWLYLHADKGSPSEFGGVVLGFEAVADASLARPARVVLVVRKQPEGTGQRWRGKGHAMAHRGGLVDAGLPHETG